MFNMVSHFSKMNITLPLVLGGPEVGVGTSENWPMDMSNRGSCPGAHTSESRTVPPPAAPSTLDEESAGSGAMPTENLYPPLLALTLSTQGYKIASPYGPEPVPRVYMGLSSESRLPRLECTPLGIGMHTPRPKRESRHSSLLEVIDKAWLYGL